ncbi:uncharacterized protein N7518_001328 [Penicillium psychrosexuale]|uniref:uncharacterized protein n=1 Tax=Penicillium psychrosexuale TaxID=1002107 RepID=UPI0025456AC8|nr:uncharacterized protein N7518_001328 [Penicillium psychrosexuale]KAJ5799260.1 hypothetical protein N7518_001328 [Penicillium psychrosexuale]
MRPIMRHSGFCTICLHLRGLFNVLHMPDLKIFKVTEKENHAYVLQKAECEVYLSTEHVAKDIKAALEHAPEIQYMAAPSLDDLFRDKEPIAIEYTKPWDDAKDDPWLVFHSSGTTEAPASLPDVAESHIHQYANKRWYTHLPTLHYVGMVMVLFIPPFINMTAILPPPDQSPENVAKILRYARADGALCTPLLLSQMLSFTDGVEALKSLEYVHYAGAPLARHLGNQIISDTKLAPLIGCTESGHHFTETRPDDKEDWDYFKFQPHAGVEFEHRADDFYGMVFVRRPECVMQPIFIAFPELERFETKDLWIQHPTRKGLWKIVCRMDDFVSLTDAKGYFVSSFEREIEQHPRVEAALIGGNGCSDLVLLLEITNDGVDVDTESGRRSFFESLEPYLSKISDSSLLKLEPKLTIIARKDKPFVRTIKGTLARVPILQLYEDDIAALFDGST